MKKSFYLDSEIVVIGLGYVGFPLAIKLSSVFKVIGFDISSNRINELKEGKDLTREIKKYFDKNGYPHLEVSEEDEDDDWDEEDDDW